jgi:hypothetical protein
MAGSTVSTVMHTAGGLTDGSYRDTALGILRSAIRLMYLLPEVYDNILNAIREVEEGACESRHFAGYLSLFIFYLEYRMNGENPEVVSLFESRVSLAKPTTIAEISRILAQKAGESAEPVASPVDPGAGSAHTVSNKAPCESTPVRTESGADRLESKPWFHFIRKSSLIFWLVVSALGLILAIVPAVFPGKSLISSGIVGAGIAGILSEFTFYIDRRDADSELRDEEQRYSRLVQHIAQVDSLTKRAEIVAINQMFKLGMDLYRVRFGDENEIESFRGEAEELAGFLGLSPSVQKFLNSEYLRPSAPPSDGQDPFLDLMRAVALRYAQEGLTALRAGAALGLLLTAGLADDGMRAAAITLLKRSVGLLYLQPEARDNMVQAMRELEEGTCTPADFLGYLTVFSFYLTYRMTGELAEVAPLFESRVSLAQPSTAAEIRRILVHVAGGTHQSESAGEVPGVANLA